MARFVRFLLSVLLGVVIGSAVNMGLVMLGGKVVPPPPGVDVTTTAGLKASMHLLDIRHFMFPFLAHALGTLAGAFVACRSAPDRSATPAWIVGAVSLAGGVAAVAMLPAPVWFSAVDLLLASLPMAWLGQRIARDGRPTRSA